MAPDSPTTFSVLLAPGHAPDMWPKVTDAMTRTGAEVIFPSEFYRLADTAPEGYVSVVGKSDTDTRAVASPQGDAGDNPILIDKKHRVRHRGRHKVDDPAPQSREEGKFAPERWLYVADVDFDGTTVTVISVHPSPLFVGRLKWLKVMRSARREVLKAKAAGNQWILAGDLQTAGRLVTFMLRGLGMKTWHVGVCWLAWSNGLKEFGAARKVFRPNKDMDHEWMQAIFSITPTTTGVRP